MLTEVANSESTHWKYSIAAIRLLRTLVRRDEALYAPQLKHFLEKTCAAHPSMRYVSPACPVSIISAE